MFQIMYWHWEFSWNDAMYNIRIQNCKSMYYVFNLKIDSKKIAVNILTEIASESEINDLYFLISAFLWLQTFI